MATNVKGVQAVVKALKKVGLHHAIANEKGLSVAGLYIQRESQLLVPVDTGALRNSANTRREGHGWQAVVKVTYGTDYALFVHEDLEAHHPIGQAKFLESVLRTKRREIIEIYRKQMEKAKIPRPTIPRPRDAQGRFI